MTLMLLVLALLGGLELLLFVPVIWRYRGVPATIVLLALAVVSGGLFTRQPLIAGLFVLSIGLYRLFNLVRIASSSIDPRRLRSMTWRTSWGLLLTQATAIGLTALAERTNLSARIGWVGLALVQLIGAGSLVLSIRRQLRKTLPAEVVQAYGDHELPTITVCVPARNETDTLAECLRTIIDSDYPKLEVIVLDDCSQDKTSEVIKAFAHDGVRFLHGTVPADTWLPKNWAYQQLYEAANGEYLIFCGVDIRFEPGSLRALVTAALSRNKTMVCLLPQNISPPDMRPTHSTLLQPMRYAWELALPRRHFNRPPALSSCWLIERKLLQKGGSFASISRSVDPERALARLAAQRDGYSFLQSTAALVVTSQKSLSAQLNTAIRLRYPQLRRRPELVWLTGLVEVICFIGPLPLCAGALVSGQVVAAIVSGLAFVLGNYGYFQIVRLTYRRFLWRGLLALPFAALADLALRNYSMWQYEFSEVYWKGRNVCLPVMQVIPKLPNIER